MIADKETAENVVKMALEASRILNDALILARGGCREDEFYALRKATGKVLGEIFISLLDPIYKGHPDIKPVGLDLSL